MNLSDIKEVPLSHRHRRRVGRGSGSGKGRTSGRGFKGEKSRSGGPHKTKMLFEGGTTPLFRRLPKRGFNNDRFRREWVTVNLEQLNSFAPGSEVNYDTLAKANLIATNKSHGQVFLKILGDGDLKVEKLKIRAHKVSASAKEKLQKSQATIALIPIVKKLKKWVKKHREK